MFKDKLNFKELPVVLNQVRFYLYTDKEKYKWNSINFPPEFKKEKEYQNAGMEVNESKICFSSFNRQLNNSKYNRIIFIFEKSKCVGDPTMKRWLTLCKRNGLLPKYASVARIMKRKSLVLDTSKHTRNLMYMYLTVCRFPQEDPCMVFNTLTLCEKYGMDFFVALVFATQIRMNNMGHHFLPGDSIYMKPKNVDMLKDIRVQDMIGLYRFIKKEGPQRGSKESFNANSSVDAQCGLTLHLKAKDLLNPMLSKIVRAKTDEKAKKLIKEAKLG